MKKSRTMKFSKEMMRAVDDHIKMVEKIPGRNKERQRDMSYHFQQGVYWAARYLDGR